MTEKGGDYCTICGGIVSGGNDIKKITVSDKEVGINGLELIIEDVKKLNLTSFLDIKEELIKRAGALNYIPSKKREAYAEALFLEYKRE